MAIKLESKYMPYQINCHKTSNINTVVAAIERGDRLDIPQTHDTGTTRTQARTVTNQKTANAKHRIVGSIAISGKTKKTSITVDKQVLK